MNSDPLIFWGVCDVLVFDGGKISWGLCSRLLVGGTNNMEFPCDPHSKSSNTNHRNPIAIRTVGCFVV
jgi:hypothetical protein